MSIDLPIMNSILPIVGIRLGTARAGIRYPDRRDLVVIEAAAGTQTAAVFTRNAFCAAPVILARAHLAQAKPRYLVINTGNANAGTGQGGLDDARQVCAECARLQNCQSHEVLPFSTGVIGERLPLPTFMTGLPVALAALDEQGWEDAAWGILTTDTRPKLISRQERIDGQFVTVTGMAKGAGMIRPDMATLLAFIATDAKVDQLLLQMMLNQAVADSFNAITIDGDTSTNDACVLLASGQGELDVQSAGARFDALAGLIRQVCIELAQALVRDGEGATKFITISVEQGRSVDECRQVAYTVAHSPLVKTAFFASDPNWGRILAAIGRSGLDQLDVNAINIYLDDVCIVSAGGRAADYTEAKGQAVMDREAITIRIELGRGEAQARVWTTDLSFDYVKINAEYRS